MQHNEHVHLTPNKTGQYICNIHSRAQDKWQWKKGEEEEEEDKGKNKRENKKKMKCKQEYHWIKLF